MFFDIKYTTSTTRVLDFNQIDNVEKLYFYGVKNEYECCQLVVKTDISIKDIHLCAKDIKLDNECISKESFDIYIENYSEINEGSAFSIAFGSGLYPDALIHQSFLENHSFSYDKLTSKDDFYTFWIVLKIPQDCRSGMYRGNFVLKLLDESVNIPVEIEVCDYCLSDASTMNTSFGVFCDYLDPKYQTDDEMIDICIEEHLNYRLNPFFHFYNYPSADKIVSIIDKYFDNPRFLSFGLPDLFGAKTQQDRIDKFREIILKLAEKSHNGRNLLSKIYVYFFDEPEGNNIVNITEKNYDYYHSMLRDVLDVINNDHTNKYEDFKKIDNYSDFILNLKSLGTITLGIKSAILQDETDIWCPSFADFTDENFVDQAVQICKKKGIELWWYGCMGPRYPFPTYHFADRLLSSRAVSWMQYYYGLNGNLYWRSYGIFVNELNMLDNLKGECEKSFKPFGDGFLFYNGSLCDQKNPLPSIRLMSIRDGIEDYELLCELEKKLIEYKEFFDSSFDPHQAVKTICRRIFDNIYATNDIKLFNQVRKDIIKKLSNKYVIPYAVGSIEYLANKGVATFYSVPNSSLYINNVELKGVNGVFKYSFDLIASVNKVKVVVKQGTLIEEHLEVLSNYVDYFDIISTSKLKDAFKINNANSSIDVCYSSVRKNIVSKGVNIALQYVSDEHPEIIFDLNCIDVEFLKNVQKICFSVYNCESRSLTIFEKLCGDGNDEYIEANELFPNRENIINYEIDLLKNKLVYKPQSLKLILRNTYPKDIKKDMEIILDSFKIYFNE